MKNIITSILTTLCISPIISSCNISNIVKEENAITYDNFKNKYTNNLDLIPTSALNIYYAQYLDGMVPRGEEYLRFDLNREDYDLWINKYEKNKNTYDEIKIEQPCPEIEKLSFWPITLNNVENLFFSIEGPDNKIYNIQLYSSYNSEMRTIYMIIKYM